LKAFCLSGSESAMLVAEEIPEPRPGPDEVLVRVCAAGVTPTELSWYPTTHRKDGEKRVRAVPGHEFSGVIAAVGQRAEGFAVGQEVFGMNDWFADGAMAEYCVAQASSIAAKPASLTHAEAASVPIGALTAWQGLVERAKLQAGERVLVQGGAGAVGVFSIQLANWRGAYVIATASPRNLELLRQLGADLVIDYKAVPFEQETGEVDVVFDTVGGETLRRSWSVLKPSGRMVAIAADSEQQTDERVKQAFFIVEPSRQQLREIGSLLVAGRIKPVIDAVVPFAETPAAYEGKTEKKQGRGKVVVEVRPDSAGSSLRGSSGRT
jgi:NADPH:quinone reductase-like Zn-dependent oxidoreductase